jgi:HAD superfamily hydrolase (TIGR01509 family)
MKTILVDAVDAFVVETENRFEIFEQMQNMLDEFPNTKIILTGANDEQFKKFGLDKMPYDVFTLKHDPEKTNPEYYKKMLEHFNLTYDNVVYFEHNPEAVKSAESMGIKTYYWDNEKRPLVDLKLFLENNTIN